MATVPSLPTFSVPDSKSLRKFRCFVFSLLLLLLLLFSNSLLFGFECCLPFYLFLFFFSFFFYFLSMLFPLFAHTHTITHTLSHIQPKPKTLFSLFRLSLFSL